MSSTQGFDWHFRRKMQPRRLSQIWCVCMPGAVRQWGLKTIKHPSLNQIKTTVEGFVWLSRHYSTGVFDGQAVLWVASKEHEVEPTPKMTLAERMGYGVRGKQIVAVSVTRSRCVKLVLVCMPMHEHVNHVMAGGRVKMEEDPTTAQEERSPHPKSQLRVENTQGNFYELNSMFY